MFFSLCMYATCMVVCGGHDLYLKILISFLLQDTDQKENKQYDMQCPQGIKLGDSNTSVMIAGSWDSLFVRAPDSRPKGCEFKSRQEQRENFLLQSQLCVLTLIRSPFHPRVTAVARKRPRPFCRKCRWQVTSKHAYTLDSAKSERANYTALQA